MPGRDGLGEQCAAHVQQRGRDPGTPGGVADQPADAQDVGDGGRARVRIAAPMALSIAENLAGWGAGVEVVDPASVRAELARIGAELVARYGTDESAEPPESEPA